MASLTLLSDLLGPFAQSLPSTVCKTITTDAKFPEISYITLQSTQETALTVTGHIDQPTVHLTFRPHTAPRSTTTSFLGFQCSEFALPVRASGPNLNFDFFSRPNYTRPRSIFPLFVLDSASDHCLLLAPVDSFHEQVLSVRPGSDSDIRWGWSGSLQCTPVDFQTTLAVISGTSPRELLDLWGALVRERAQPTLNHRRRFDDVSMAKLSLWTDNGSSYWYRTEQGLDLPTTLESTVKHLEKIQVPIASVELDSWFYPHEVSRRVTDIGYPDVVPPTGMLRWEPREDVLGEGGIAALRDRIGARPLILHSRHISSKSGYVNDASLEMEGWWVDGDRAHPIGDGLFRLWMQQAAVWGATTYEQDWLVEIWQGVRQLRERVGRIAQWQMQLNEAADGENVNLIWCMATPCDMAQAVSLGRVVAIRSCDDYRYAKDASILWRWHLTVSCVIRSLGLWPFKDVFMSHGNKSGVVDIDGDPNALLEACLSALSAGPVGIGDRMGRTDAEVVRATCRADGVLIKPDLPLAALDRSLRDPDGLLWAETNCGLWRYVVCIATGMPNGPSDLEALTESLELGGDDRLIYEWRSREVYCGTRITVSLRRHEWRLWVVCPIVDVSGGRCALVGDVDVFATMGDRRFRTHTSASTKDKVSFDVLGVQGETVNVGHWSDQQGFEISEVAIPSKGWEYASLEIPNNLPTLKPKS